MRKLLRTIISAIISLTVSIPVSAMNRSNGTYTALNSFQYSYKMAATTGQSYKFGDKELVTANRLNEYDFGARQYYPAVTRIDPMVETYPWLSPYLYCANNPVNLVDPTGKDSWTLDEMGNIMTYLTTDKYDEIIVINRKNEDVNVSTYNL